MKSVLYCDYAIFGGTCSDTKNCLYRIMKYITCDTMDVIYLIICSQCGPVYVGETERPLRMRIGAHLGDIRHSRSTPVAEHFNLAGHSIADFKFTGIDHVYGNNRIDSTRKRHSLKQKYISQLNTLKPAGVNVLTSNIGKKKHVALVLPFGEDSSFLAKQICRKVDDNLQIPVHCAFTMNRSLKNILCPSKLESDVPV